MKKKLNILLTAIGSVLIYILIQTGVQFIYTFVVYFQNISHDSSLSESVFIAIFSMKQKKEILSLISIILTGIIFYFKYYRNQENKRISNIHLKKCSINQILHMFITGISITILLYLLTLFLLEKGMILNKGTNLMEMSLSHIIISILTIGVLVPIFEEILFRGIVYGTFNNIFNKWVAIIVQAIIFTSIHSYGIQYIYTFILAITLGLFYTWNKNIMYCFVIHVIFNLLGTYILPYLIWTKSLIIISFTISTILLIISLLWQRKHVKDQLDETLVV